MDCLLSWEKLLEMKDRKSEFWTADGNRRLKIVEVDQKTKSIYMVCIQTGKITWPLKYHKLKEVHEKLESGEIGLVPNEIERLIPTWGNYITGLLISLGCREHISKTEGKEVKPEKSKSSRSRRRQGDI